MISERYKKALVTVAMGFRTEEDIRNNGLYRFNSSEKDKLIELANTLFKKRHNLLALKIKPTGFRSEHINITSAEELQSFVNNLDSIFGDKNEIWVVNSSSKECWRCRLNIDSSNKYNIEMAYSDNDHIIDAIGANPTVKYVCYSIIGESISVVNSNLAENDELETRKYVKDIFYKYGDEIEKVKQDLEFINIQNISLDIRIDNGYDFHDFDVSYDKVSNVIDFYYNIYCLLEERKKQVM